MDWRQAIEQILDKASQDPTFKERLVNDPEDALRHAGLLPTHEPATRVSARECEEPTCNGDTCGDGGSTCDVTCENSVTCALKVSV